MRGRVEKGGAVRRFFHGADAVAGFMAAAVHRIDVARQPYVHISGDASLQVRFFDFSFRLFA